MHTSRYSDKCHTDRILPNFTTPPKKRPWKSRTPLGVSNRKQFPLIRFARIWTWIALISVTPSSVLSQDLTDERERDSGTNIGPTDPFLVSYQNDDCSKCCHVGDAVSIDTTLVPSCCVPTSSNLFNTPNGECSGLPCCSYSGRQAQNHQTWFPCMNFPSCRFNSSKQSFCAGSTTWSYTELANFECSDPCCHEAALRTNIWTGVSSAYPGQINATFSVIMKRDDYVTSFYGNDPSKRLKQIMIASPIGYNFTTTRPNCTVEVYLNDTKPLHVADQSNPSLTVTPCFVTLYANSSGTGVTRMYLTINVPPKHQLTYDPLRLTFNYVNTPTGLNASQLSTTRDGDQNTLIYTTDSNLTPVHYIFDDENGGVFSSFLRVDPLEAASISSASFVPENIYPGNAGNASLSFYSNARIPAKSTISITFDRRWKFSGSETWYIETGWDTTKVEYPMNGTNTTTRSLASTIESSDIDVLRVLADTNASAYGKASVSPIENSRYTASTGQWQLKVAQAIEKGWVLLSVSQVQNPSVSYTGLNQIMLGVYDPNDQLVVDGTISSISVDSMTGASASSYSYVSIVVLVGSLLFCSAVIRSNGLSFSLGSIWTDITAVCTVLELSTAILNNIFWTIERSSAYFYISRVQLCFTFTMLLAVSFHWGTVLSLRLRKLPKKKVCFAFVLLNAGFYGFQLVFLLAHIDLIDRVYAYEEDPSSLMNLQCKGDDAQLLSSAFSDLPRYLWSCYVNDQEQFFLVSTTVTYAVFLALTVVVMALGVMVMRRGRSLLCQMTGLHELVLRKALRLYYALIGVVTLIYLLSWIVQLLSKDPIPYPWYYIFTVWLPYSIPPCCLVFLQWNSTAKSLREVPNDSSFPQCQSEITDEEYEQVETPSCSFASSSWSEGNTSKLVDALIKENEVRASVSMLQRQSQRAASIHTYDDKGSIITQEQNGADVTHYISLSLILEINEVFEQGCYIGIQRLEWNADTNRYLWKQISNTDTVHSSNIEVVGPLGRHVYSFMSVPRISLGYLAEEKLRLVVYSVKELLSAMDRRDPSVITAEAVIARLHSSSIDQSTNNALEQAELWRHFTTTEDGVIHETEDEFGSQAVDELFEDESDYEDDEVLQEERPALASQWTVVAEFGISMDRLVEYGSRGEQMSLIAAEQSFRTIRESSVVATPPKLLIHPVMPRYSQTGGVQAAANAVNGMPLSQSISSQYHIREQGLLVVEDLTEGRFNNLIPRQVVEIIVHHRAKCLLQAQQDLSRVDSYDRVRAKTSSRNIYENLIEQIQDDGDLTRCREWLSRRLEARKQYVKLLYQLRKVYKRRDENQQYFKPSTVKKNGTLRFLPVNLHLHEMWVAKVDSLAKSRQYASQSSYINQNAGDDRSKPSTVERSAVYDTVTVGAMAAHVYKFRGGGILGLQEQRTKMQGRQADQHCQSTRQDPLWTESQQKADDLEWEIQKRMDVCFPQAIAALVTAFTRKLDFAVQVSTQSIGRRILDQFEKVGFLFDVESLLSTHGNEAGMLEDMAAAVNELRNVQFVLVEEQHEALKGLDQHNAPTSHHDRPLTMQTQLHSCEVAPAASTSSTNAATTATTSVTNTATTSDSRHSFHPDSEATFYSGNTDINTDTCSSMLNTFYDQAGVTRVDVFSSIEKALQKYPNHPFWQASNENRHSCSSDDSSRSGSNGQRRSNNRTVESFGIDRATSMLSSGQKFLHSFFRKSKQLRTGPRAREEGDFGCIPMSQVWNQLFHRIFRYTHLVIRVTLRTAHVPLSRSLCDGAMIRVCPVLFSQGINEKQTIANSTKPSTRQLQDVINTASLRSLRSYCGRYNSFFARMQASVNTQAVDGMPSRELIEKTLAELENLICLSHQTRKKRPEILQLSSDLVRLIGGGRVTCCKSAKDRTGMSVTLEQGRILVANHQLPESKKAEIVAVMRSEGVRIENCWKNTGRRMYAFNAIQRSLLPEEYRCPPQTGGSNLS
uniref:Type I inositol3 putative n=1 Tax=Albugo laibachii Nc14 TaxID=890382 RepID=F0WVL0_9STRA|nr:type I inositol3 putative [Albugo laibachii Nc14]|eukprot:CCA25452.1 type I inositol3 putative [Albugo laibachii Nc14]